MKILYLCLLLLCAPKLSAQEELPPVIDTISLQLRSMNPYNPPTIYSKWWIETQRCAKRYVSRAQYNRVTWRYVMADAFVVREGDPKARFVGITSPWHNTITVVLHHVLTERVIKHEMLHFVLYHNGIAGHDSVAFTNCKV